MTINNLNKLNKRNYYLDLDLSQIELSDGSKADLKINRSYYLKGIVGSGKTTVALQLAKKFKAEYDKQIIGDEVQEDCVHFIKYYDLMKLFKRFDKEARQEVIELQEVPFLIIDDLGLGYGKEHSLIELQNFIDERMGLFDEGVTIFTTNVEFNSDPELKKEFARILSRIQAICTRDGIIELNKRDNRATSDLIQFNFNSAIKVDERLENINLTFDNTKPKSEVEEKIKAIKSKLLPHQTLTITDEN